MKRWIGGWMVLLVALGSATWVPPVEGGAPFRRDQLPVDVATMTSLSAQLVSLAEHLDGKGAESRRTRAQLIALALALDPANRRARDLGEALAQGDEPAGPADGRLVEVRSRAWNLLGWLEQPEAGEAGQALGACLSDVLARADPEHPESERRRGREAGQWEGWVAGLAAFRQKKPENPPAEAPPVAGGSDQEPVGAKPVRRRASVRVPLWVTGEGQPRAELKIVPMEVRVLGGDEEDFLHEPGLRVRGPHRSGSEWARKAGPLLQAALEARHGPLPERFGLQFSLPEGGRFSWRNHGGATGAMLVAADALFTGVEPLAEVFAELKDDGSLGLPGGFWETLRSLAESKGGRLVLPEAARGLLPYLLTLDQVELLMGHELLLAADVESMITLASSQPPERLGQASEIFRQIREERGTRSLGSFVSSAAVRQRFGQMVEWVPEHASAHLLALRGTSKWPQRLDRAISAREVRASLDPMREVLSSPRHRVDVRQLLEADQACRERLKSLEKLYDSVEDREQLQDPALATVKSLSSLVSSLRRRGEDFDDSMAISPVVRSYVETVKMLTEVAGDGAEYPIPFDEN